MFENGNTSNLSVSFNRVGSKGSSISYSYSKTRLRDNPFSLSLPFFFNPVGPTPRSSTVTYSLDRSRNTSLCRSENRYILQRCFRYVFVRNPVWSPSSLPLLSIYGRRSGRDPPQLKKLETYHGREKSSVPLPFKVLDKVP